MKRWSKDFYRIIGRYLSEEDLAHFCETSRFINDTYSDRKWLDKIAKDRKRDVEFKEGESYLKQLRAAKNLWFFEYLQEKLDQEDTVFEERDLIRDFVREANIYDIKRALLYVTGENFSDNSKEIFINLLEDNLGEVGKKNLVKRYINLYFEDGKYLEKYLPSENILLTALYGPSRKSFNILMNSALRNRRDDLYDIFKSEDFREDFANELNSYLFNINTSEEFHNYLSEVSRDLY